MPEIPENLREPFRLFVEELKANLDIFRKALTQEAFAPEELELMRKKLEGRFHLVRGGAGFFNLNEIRNAATEGEEGLRKLKGDADAIEKFQAERLPELVKILEDQLATLV